MFLLLAAIGVQASATTIVPMTDHDLTVSVRAIVEGRVTAVEAAWDPEQAAVFSYVSVDVARTYKGDVPPGTIVLKQLGGIVDGHVTAIFGAPELAAGQRVLLFLNTDDDGALRVAHLMLGDFRVETDPATGQEVVARSIGEAQTVGSLKADAVTSRAPYAGFVETMLATLAADADEVSRYAAKAGAVPIQLVPREFASLPHAAAKTDFTFLRPGFRWFEGDSGQKIMVKVDGSGAPSNLNGVDQAKAAFAAWSGVSNSSLNVAYDGPTTACGLRDDSTSAISFGDCRNQMDDPVNCSGVVAIGGVSRATSDTVTIDGKAFLHIVEGDVSVNNGFDCLIGDPVVLSEVLTHEFGHALGFGHSSENQGETNATLRDATMYFITHNDGRGGAVRDDDAAAAQFLYPKAPRAGTPLSVVSTLVPEAKTGAAYAYQLRAAGGSGGYAWSVSAGSLPSGISLAADGTFSGRALNDGTAAFTVTVRDSQGSTQRQSLTIRATASPAPFVDKTSFKAAGKLVVTGLYFDASATIEVNGRVITPPLVAKFVADKNRLKVTGSAADMNVRQGSSNTIVVTVGGRRSNPLTF